MKSERQPEAPRKPRKGRDPVPQARVTVARARALGRVVVVSGRTVR